MISEHTKSGCQHLVDYFVISDMTENEHSHHNKDVSATEERLEYNGLNMYLKRML